MDCLNELEKVRDHYEALNLTEQVISWFKQKLDDLSIRFLWSCENGKERLVRDLVNKQLDFNVRDEKMATLGYNTLQVQTDIRTL